MTSFLNISFNDKRIEIGWSWIALEYQGEGFNRIVKKILISFVFENLNFERVEFKTDLLNVQARKALSKIGCVEEGILRSHTQMHDGRRRDTVYYSIIRKDWDNKN